jgi:hypothetical protein
VEKLSLPFVTVSNENSLKSSLSQSTAAALAVNTNKSFSIWLLLSSSFSLI